MSKPSEQRCRQAAGCPPEKIREEDTDAFYASLTLQNFSRIRMIAVVALAIFSPLWVWDLIRFFRGDWQQSIGYPIIAFSHTVLLLLLAGILSLARREMPEDAASIQRFHQRFINGSLAIVMACTLPLALGDLLVSGAIDVYMGMIFAVAAIFVLSHRFRLILFGTYMASTVVLLIGVHLEVGWPITTHIVNVVAFAIVAFILSRALFGYFSKDFFNRRLIDRQSMEIKQQNEKNEELITELTRALEEVKTLSGFLPICSVCKKIRDDQGYWNQIESYISDHSEAQFSHGICPACMEKTYPEEYKRIRAKKSERIADVEKTDEPE